MNSTAREATGRAAGQRTMAGAPSFEELYAAHWPNAEVMAMDELPPDAKAWLRLANAADHPPIDAADRVRRRLVLALGASAIADSSAMALEASPPAMGKAVSLVSSLKVAVVAMGVCGIGAVGWLWRSPSEQDLAPRPAQPAIPPAPLAEVEPPLQAAPQAHAEQAAKQTQQPVGRKPRKRTLGSDARLRDEVELLSAASAALEFEDVAKARMWLEKHRGQFPRGVLAQERRGLEALAQCIEVGEQARDQAADFLSQEPRSFVNSRIRAACRMESKP